MKKYLMAFSFAAMLATGLFLAAESAEAHYPGFDPGTPEGRRVVDVLEHKECCLKTSYAQNCGPSDPDCP